MNTTRFYLTLCIAVLAFQLSAQDVPEAVQQLSRDYQQLLRNGAYEQAADHLHISTSYVMHEEQWVAGQKAKINEDMTMRTTLLDTDQQQVSTKQVGDRTFYLYSVPEEIEVSLQGNEKAVQPKVLAAVMDGFATSYGEDRVKSIDNSRFAIQYNHQFMIVPVGKDADNWKVIDFPSGQLDMAYGILPAGVWEAFFPNKTLPDNMPYPPAVKQTVGHYFNLLRAKEYENAANFTLPQPTATAPFMQWYKSLDTEESELALWNYRITSPIRSNQHDGKRYAGLTIEWTLMLELTAEVASAEVQRNTQEALEQMYPDTEIIYSDEFQVYSWKVSTPAIAVTDLGKNNWQLLLEDEVNGMSINRNIDLAILQAVGMD